MWKAGIAICTRWFNNAFARIAGSSWKRRIASDSNPEFSRSFRENTWKESIFVCSQFPLKPVHRSSGSVCRELKESQLNGTSREFTCVSAWGVFFLSTPGATG